MEYTLKKAINQAKRELKRCGLYFSFGGYESLWNTFKEVYFLRDDEKEPFLKSIKKYVEKNCIA